MPSESRRRETCTQTGVPLFRNVEGPPDRFVVAALVVVNGGECRWGRGSWVGRRVGRGERARDLDDLDVDRSDDAAVVQDNEDETSLRSMEWLFR